MQPTPPPAPTPPQPPDLVQSTAQQAQALAELQRAAQAATDANAAAGARAAPRTAQDIAGLRQQREELSSQLISTQRRRAEVARDLRHADQASAPGLQQRLGLLDRRIIQLEGDIAETGRLITSASPALLAQSEVERPRFGNGDRGPPKSVVAIVFILFVLFPMVVAFTRRLGRGPRTSRPDPALREAAERLGRLEQAVEAIAIEVERVSEGQRFVTRVLAESRGGTQLAAPADTADAPAAQYARPNG